MNSVLILNSCVATLPSLVLYKLFVCGAKTFDVGEA